MLKSVGVDRDSRLELGSLADASWSSVTVFAAPWEDISASTAAYSCSASSSERLDV